MEMFFDSFLDLTANIVSNACVTQIFVVNTAFSMVYKLFAAFIAY